MSSGQWADSGSNVGLPTEFCSVALESAPTGNDLLVNKRLSVGVFVLEGPARLGKHTRRGQFCQIAVLPGVHFNFGASW